MSNEEKILRSLELLKDIGYKSDSIKAIKHLPAQEGQYRDYPDDVHPALREALAAKGFTSLYSHQRSSWEALKEGKNVVVVTPTASGKTLCYNLPVLDAIMKDPSARALYLFPTKALSQDQQAELDDINARLPEEIRVFTYDGDTPQDARKAIRARGHIVLTNPDMLHAGILPHHTKWIKLFENLKYIVIDELHNYRGIFGSHLANVLRRLKRIARFYGADPQFILCTATIANPAEMAEKMIEAPVALVDDNGAPRGGKYFVFYTPPVVNAALGIRRSYVNESRRVASIFLKNGLQTIVFAGQPAHHRGPPDLPQGGHRDEHPEGGAHPRLPGRLPAAEAAGDREGPADGRDPGRRLDQRPGARHRHRDARRRGAGRLPGDDRQHLAEGRAGPGARRALSAAVLVATSSPLDQFIINNPEYFFSKSPEMALINPDNLSILVSHIECAAFELPFEDGETFGRAEIGEILDFLEEDKLLHHSKDKWFYTSEAYPADAISLRSISSDNFVVVDITGEARVIAEVDFTSALTALHPKAIYIVEGEQYFVEKLDFEERKAYVKKTDIDYYTDAIDYTKITILDVFDKKAHRGRDGPGLARRGPRGDAGRRLQEDQVPHHGERRRGRPAAAPERDAHDGLLADRAVGAHAGGPLPGRAADQRPVRAGLSPPPRLADLHDVRHPRRRRVDRRQHLGRARAGRGSCRPGRPARGRRRCPVFMDPDFEPNIFIYDNFPGGIGLSPSLFALESRLLEHGLKTLEACPCRDGCPSCVGATNESGKDAKKVARVLLQGLLGLDGPRSPRVN